MFGRVAVVNSIFAVCVLAFLMVGCELRRSSQPSVLVIAVEGLGFDSVNCDDDEPEDQTQEGLRVFCQEAVRFSHAYSPSPLAQAALATLMTGLYPLDHGVHNNGAEFLSAKFNTLAEGALSRGYRTLFVSGGVPIWRKSGLAQGFEVFDDTMDLGLGQYYRPANQVVNLATNWLSQYDGSPTLSVLFLNDLQFPQIATRAADGEVRVKSREGQLAEVDESLGALIKWLKARKRWNFTHVVLAGVNALDRRESDNEPVPLSLRSTSVQVTLFIKPARKEQDNVIQWAVDRNVSLVDVGNTLFSWVGLQPPKGSLAELAAENLNQALTRSEPDWRPDRLVVSESAWPDWLEGSGTRWAIRQNQFLYIHDKHPLIFNTLTDRMEGMPLKPSDPLWTSLNSQIVSFLSHAHMTRWSGMNRHWLEQIEVARELWRSDSSSRTPTGTEAWARWYLGKALAQGNWREVKRLSIEAGEPIGAFVAARHLGESPALPRNPCVRLVLASHAQVAGLQSECEDEEALALYSWKNANDDERPMAQERFLRLLQTDLMDQEIGRLNFLNELRWDVDREWPRAPRTVDYLLTLKELEPLNKKVSGLLSGKDFAF